MQSFYYRKEESDPLYTVYAILSLLTFGKIGIIEKTKNKYDQLRSSSDNDPRNIRLFK
ncbi:hypothetical protein [Paenibacillus bovis]|uniref:hypothetical protein n=1 Tax=Paenibacillus bovis TaxID=1616788 RepID=UPI000AE4F19E|nr:hypothetical protein [Paenibacillus bovis]